MKKTLVLVMVSCAAAPAFAQAPQAPPAVEISGSLMSGVQQFDNTTNSSKLTEYRDFRDSFFLPRVTFSAVQRRTGWFFDLSGTNVNRDDQTILAATGRPGVWNVNVNWTEIPHVLSTKALTPYLRRGPGLFEVPATIPVTYKKLATTAADTAGVVATDALVAQYQAAILAPTPLGTQTNAGRFAWTWLGSEALALAIGYDRREKSGLKPTFGPIGDRPPRTLNIQLTEPVDYRTNDIALSTEHQGRGYQVRADYMFSDFANRIDTLQWENVYATPDSNSSYDTWDRLVAAYGVRPLPPDNRYHHAAVSAGVDMPLDSRLTGSLAYGRLEQNEMLPPYAFQVDVLANPTLPRSTADARMSTLNLAADYTIAPTRRVNLRAFVRRNDLDNRTPSSRWQYVTQDTTNLNGSVAYVNKRVSLPYAWDRQNAGAYATWRLPGRTSLEVGYEREAIGREFREADTAEHLFRAAWRTRARPWLSVRGRYVRSVRDSGDYFNQITHEGYWYAPSEATDANNPALTFDNHPDMRRFDVSDRLRRQADLTVNLTPRSGLAMAASVRYRHDDFDSDVAPSQPLLGTGLPDERATTPGDQLGLLKNRRLGYGVDVFAGPGARVTFNAFVTYDRGTSLQRGLEFNENNKQNPGAVATAELGPWTRRGSQWTADFDDRTWSGGVGAALQLVPDRVTLVADYTVSLADIGITYAGYGVTNFDGTPFAPNHQFAFSSPPVIREDLHMASVRFEVPVGTVTVIAGYSYERYLLDDWQQASNMPWVEPVGSDTLLRDTSRSFQWGNRLFNLGTYLAPGYDAHIGFAGFNYRF